MGKTEKLIEANRKIDSEPNYLSELPLGSRKFLKKFSINYPMLWKNFEETLEYIEQNKFLGKEIDEHALIDRVTAQNSAIIKVIKSLKTGKDLSLIKSGPSSFRGPFPMQAELKLVADEASNSEFVIKAVTLTQSGMTSLAGNSVSLDEAKRSILSNLATKKEGPSPQEVQAMYASMILSRGMALGGVDTDTLKEHLENPPTEFFSEKLNGVPEFESNAILEGIIAATPDEIKDISAQIANGLTGLLAIAKQTGQMLIINETGEDLDIQNFDDKHGKFVSSSDKIDAKIHIPEIMGLPAEDRCVAGVVTCTSRDAALYGPQVAFEIASGDKKCSLAMSVPISGKNVIYATDDAPATAKGDVDKNGSYSSDGKTWELNDYTVETKCNSKSGKEAYFIAFIRNK